MSEELKRKLYNYEVNPPETTWRKIASLLAEETNAEFPEKLHEYEITPPIGIWNKIEEELEKENKEKYPVKLYNLEVDPPKETWKKIAANLAEEKVLPTISSRGKIIPFVKYAVAASIIGIIAFATFKLINHTSGEKAVAIKTAQPEKNSSVNVTPKNENSSAINKTVVSNNLPKERPELAQNNISSRKKDLATSASYMTLSSVLPTPSLNLSSDFKQASLKGDVPGNCTVISEADRYLMFMNPDGYLVRISKKLAETLGCVYANEDNQCDEQIKKWRDKIAKSPASSSPDNFMDVLDIIKSVQD